MKNRGISPFASLAISTCMLFGGLWSTAYGKPTQARYDELVAVRLPLLLSLDKQTKTAIAMKHQEAARLATGSGDFENNLAKATSLLDKADTDLEKFANSLVKRDLTNSLPYEIRPLFSDIRLVPRPEAMAEGMLIDSANVALGLSKVSLTGSNASSSTFRMTNGQPVVFLVQYTIDSKALRRLMETILEPVMHFWRIPIST